jgi:hypothetical protein
VAAWEIAGAVGSIIGGIGVILSGMWFGVRAIKNHIDDRIGVVADTAETGVRTAMAAHRRMDEHGWPPPDYSKLLTSPRSRV